MFPDSWPCSPPLLPLCFCACFSPIALLPCLSRCYSRPLLSWFLFAPPVVALPHADLDLACFKQPCSTEFVPGTVFLLFCLLSADWWNVWQTARINGLAPTADYSDDALRGLTPDSARQEAAAPRRRSPRLPVHVVFIDGHNASPMDDGWAGLVLSVNYVKHFEGPTCFTNIYMAPYG